MARLNCLTIETQSIDRGKIHLKKKKRKQSEKIEQRSFVNYIYISIKYHLCNQIKIQCSQSSIHKREYNVKNMKTND